MTVIIILTVTRNNHNYQIIITEKENFNFNHLNYIAILISGNDPKIVLRGIPIVMS